MLDALECLLWHRPALLMISLYFNQARPQFQVTRMSLLFNFMYCIYTLYAHQREFISVSCDTNFALRLAGLARIC